MFDFANAPFAFLDLKTTGLSAWFGDRICEVGIVLCEGRRIKDTFQTLVDPQRPLSPAAARANRFTDRDLGLAPRFEEVAGPLKSWLAETVVVTHNARFDLQFLDSEFRRLGHELQIPNLIDTLTLARGYFDAPSYSLEALAEGLQISKMGDRRAFPDALKLRAVFFELASQLASNGSRLDDFIGIYNSPAWPSDGIHLPAGLEEAFSRGRRLRITYVDGGGEQTVRQVDPLQVIGLSDYLYLRAFCHLRGEERTFRLDRILDIEPAAV
ncbi:MAG: exonuclease domain-containing protein [Chloroflexota bacterium]